MNYPIIYRARSEDDNKTLLEDFFHVIADDETIDNILFIDFNLYKKYGGYFENNDFYIFISSVDLMEYFSENPNFQKLFIFFSKIELNQILSSPKINTEIKQLFLFHQIPAFDFNFSPDDFFILDKKSISKSLNLPFPDARSNPKDFDYLPLIEIICPGYIDPEYRCPNCGAAKLNSKYIENCCNNIPNIQNHLPPFEAPSNIMDIITNYSKKDPHFIRTLNRFCRPVLQKTSIQHAHNQYSTLFIQGVTYALDSRFQFLDPVYIISSNMDLETIMKKRFAWITNEQFLDIKNIISILLHENHQLNQYIHDKLNILTKKDYIAFVEESYDSNGVSVSLIDSTNPFQNQSTIEATLKTNDGSDYITTNIPPDSSIYDVLIYPLIFWNGKGGIGQLPDEAHWGTKEMKYALKSICLQPPDSYVKHCAVLLDEYLCAGYGRYMQIKVNKEFSRQLQMVQQNEFNGPKDPANQDEFGIKTYIPSSLTGSPTYWNNVSKSGFYLSMILGPPTFFITITENPKWHEVAALNDQKDVSMNAVLLARIFQQKKRSLISYIKDSKIFGKVKGLLWRDEYQKRGLPHCHLLLWTDFDTNDVDALDKIITCRLPLIDPNITNTQKTKMWWNKWEMLLWVSEKSSKRNKNH